MADELRTIRKNIITAPENAWASAKGWEPVYTAHINARIMIVGQAPGIRAQESHIPWNDRSGDALRNWLGVSRETFYDPNLFALIPMDFYFPGSVVRGDAPPRKGFAETWHPKLLSNMPRIELTLLIGQYAHKYYLGSSRKKTLTETVRHFEEYSPKYIPLVHPSPRNIMWQQKNPWFIEDVVPVIQERVQKILK